eukprot:202438-Chlamydomonas_euryale.AAC.5
MQVAVSAYALELYNEDLLDLAVASGRDGSGAKGWDISRALGAGLKLQVWTSTGAGASTPGGGVRPCQTGGRLIAQGTAPEEGKGGEVAGGSGGAGGCRRAGTQVRQWAV